MAKLGRLIGLYGMMAHELATDGEILMSIGEAPPIDGLDGLGGLAVLAGRQILDGKHYCDAGRVTRSSWPVHRTHSSAWPTPRPMTGSSMASIRA